MGTWSACLCPSTPGFFVPRGTTPIFKFAHHPLVHPLLRNNPPLVAPLVHPLSAH